MWLCECGEIPQDYCVHHIDGDYNHNSIDNFALMLASEHEKLHTDNYTEHQWKKIKEGLDNNRDKATEWHKSDAGREWHSKKAKRQMENRKYREYVCQVCGKVYTSRSIGTPKFCSNNCKSQWRRLSGVDNEERICPICGTKFIINKYSKKIFCSRKCIAKNRRNS
ncbi:HNH endonuclease [Bacteroides congonensis]|uniref:HNH endonuclease n=1 Tax=Bacteroides congonensis TaxID=1871006 RepID=UPI0037436741